MTAKKRGKNKGKKKEKKPQLHQDLEGFNLVVNQLGEIGSTMDVEEINKFLNKKVEDKKLVHREDWDELSGKEKDEDEEE